MDVIKCALGDKNLELVFNNRALMTLEDEGVDIAEMTTGKGTISISKTIKILAALCEAGKRYAALEGRPEPDVLTVDDLADNYQLKDIMALIPQVTECISGGKRKVETVPNRKNAEITPSAQ